MMYRQKDTRSIAERVSNSTVYWTLLGSLGGLNGLDQLGNNLEQVALDAVVGALEDGGVAVLVDGDDALGILHAGLVLTHDMVCAFAQPTTDSACPLSRRSPRLSPGQG